uniref:Uncharacterized protein n=1 Tax=Oryza brachyantha TaxID=4533 RepID=J3MH41_ORYBR
MCEDPSSVFPEHYFPLLQGIGDNCRSLLLPFLSYQSGIKKCCKHSNKNRWDVTPTMVYCFPEAVVFVLFFILTRNFSTLQVEVFLCSHVFHSYLCLYLHHVHKSVVNIASCYHT